MSDAAGEPSIVGAWRLTEFEARLSDGQTWRPFGEHPLGTIIYTRSGQFSGQIFRPARPRFVSDDPTGGTPEEIDAAFKGAISYFGSYTFDGALVVHRVEGSLFPNWEGAELRRAVALDGRRMTLTTPPTPWAGDRALVGALTWERVD